MIKHKTPHSGCSMFSIVQVGISNSSRQRPRYFFITFDILKYITACITTDKTITAVKSSGGLHSTRYKHPPITIPADVNNTFFQSYACILIFMIRFDAIICINSNMKTAPIHINPHLATNIADKAPGSIKSKAMNIFFSNKCFTFSPSFLA